jgi:hypothetical protein
MPAHTETSNPAGEASLPIINDPTAKVAAEKPTASAPIRTLHARRPLFRGYNMPVPSAYPHVHVTVVGCRGTVLAAVGSER